MCRYLVTFTWGAKSFIIASSIIAFGFIFPEMCVEKNDFFKSGNKIFSNLKKPLVLCTFLEKQFHQKQETKLTGKQSSKIILLLSSRRPMAVENLTGVLISSKGVLRRKFPSNVPTTGD